MIDMRAFSDEFQKIASVASAMGYGALGGGLAGAGTGALAAQPGERLRGALLGGAGGASVGALGVGLGRSFNKDYIPPEVERRAALIASGLGGGAMSLLNPAITQSKAAPIDYVIHGESPVPALSGRLEHIDKLRARSAKKKTAGLPLGMAALGAGIGGAAGAATAQPGEQRWRAALRGAGAGALAGGAGGMLMRSGGKGFANMKVQTAPTEVGGRRLLGLLGPKKVTQMPMQQALRRGADIQMTQAQRSTLGKHIRRGVLGAGVGTVGAAGAGYLGAQHAPATAQYLGQTGGYR